MALAMIEASTISPARHREGGGIYNSGTVEFPSDQIVINNCPNNCAGHPVPFCAAMPGLCP